MKCAIPGLSLLFLHHPYIEIHWIFHLLFLPSFLMCYAQCYHGDGSGERHVHMKYHDHLLYYQAIYGVGNSYLLPEAINIVAMVVMGDTCVLSITAIHTTIRLLCWQ